MTNAKASKGLLSHTEQHFRSTQATLRRGAGAIGVAYFIFMASATHGEFQKCVPLISLHFKWGYVFSGIGGLVVGEYELG